jgi:hypothetical protein
MTSPAIRDDNSAIRLQLRHTEVECSTVKRNLFPTNSPTIVLRVFDEVFSGDQPFDDEVKFNVSETDSLSEI